MDVLSTSNVIIASAAIFASDITAGVPDVVDVFCPLSIFILVERILLPASLISISVALVVPAVSTYAPTA